MALVLRHLFDSYKFFFREYNDPRVEHFPLLGSPWPVLLVIFLYLKICCSWGPKLMEHRKPFCLKSVMNVYNLAQVVINLYIGVIGLNNSYLADDFNGLCEPINQKVSPSRRKLIFVSYLYFLSKIVDLLDTIFFVLRKKNNQITFLHIYHHAGMIAATYVFSKFISGSHATLLGLINSFVHVIMYFYYFLTSFRPELKNSLWWKKHITQVQLLQFMILMVHFGLPLLLGYCDYPTPILLIGFMQNLFMFTLFADFYVKAYLKKRTKAAAAMANSNGDAAKLSESTLHSQQATGSLPLYYRSRPMQRAYGSDSQLYRSVLGLKLEIHRFPDETNKAGNHHPVLVIRVRQQNSGGGWW
ncbi:elongation of very long chain fatty acids protein 1-like [Sabethes cyaneus]|uniref:elongation of very long chain fatty acids protein 1-like n=1 Tax=Sabethes cyaneus TaxID=53552 RepID=UPI00237D8C99|nr:elongation of very long chain fatty acids protein 1-like [Sabethes cyaneus]